MKSGRTDLGVKWKRRSAKYFPMCEGNVAPPPNCR